MRFKDVKAAIEHIKTQVPIKQLVEDDLGIELKRSGKNWVTLCPFHNESEPSFRISDPDAPVQRFRCYGASCAKDGDVITWVCLRQGMDVTEAIKYLSDKYNVDVSSYMIPEDPQFTRDLEVMRHFIDYTTSNDQVYMLMGDRGISNETTDKFNVGWSSSMKDAVGYLISKGVTHEEIRRLELGNDIITEQTLVIPHCDIHGNIVGVKCRRTENDGPRYYNFSKSHPLYPDKLLFGMHIAKRFIYAYGGTLIIVEGDPDAIHMHDEEYYNTVSAGGDISALTPQQIAQLDSLQIDEIVVITDGDGPGIKSSLNICRNYKKLFADRLVRLAKLDLQYGKDPDEQLKIGGVNIITEAIENAVHPIKYYIDYIIGSYDLTNITGTYQFLAAVVAGFRDLSTIDLDILSKYVAESTDLDKEHVKLYIKQSTVDVNLYDHNAEETFIAATFSDDLRWMKGMNVLKIEDFSVFNIDLATQIFEFYDKHRNDSPTKDRFVYYLTINNRQDLIHRYSSTTLKVNDINLCIDVIQDRSTRRRIRQASEATRIQIYDLSVDVDSIATQFKLGLAARTGNMYEAAAPNNVAKEYMATFSERLSSDSTVIGLPLSSRWGKLNALWSGVQLGEVILITAPTGSGKSCIATEWGEWLAINSDGPKEPVLYINGEMKRYDAVTRVLSINTGIGNTKIRTGNLTVEEAKIVTDALALYSKGCLYIETPVTNTLSEWMNLIEFHRDKHGCKHVICDYIQLLRSDNGGNDWQSYSDASIALHARCIQPGNELGLIVVAQENEDGRQQRLGGVNYTAGTKQIGRDADKCISSRKLTREQMIAQGLQNGNMSFYVSKDRAGQDDIILNGYLSKHEHGSLRIGEVDSMGENEFWPTAELELGGYDGEPEPNR